MGNIARTKDEQVILALFGFVVVAKDDHIDIAIEALQKETKIHDKSLNIIIRNLAQANFVKKIGDHHLRLTQNGKTLAKKLLEQ